MSKKSKKEHLRKQITLNSFKFLLASYIIFVLSSCRQVSLNNLKDNFGATYISSSIDKANSKIFTDEARILDIPFPIDSKIWDINDINSSSSLHQLALRFEWDKLNKNQSVIDFYLTEMEYNGWNLVSYGKFQESCLVFQKPSKICVIIVKNLTNKIEEASIFVMSKKYF